ncbi:hypothetical protein AMJ85_07005 [candidate division BRC1 bacterium SM23_51]|nr:MAG: hypothetical protein AMJ85_07005 [candidate division BRC1 bacterium SM23_51]
MAAGAPAVLAAKSPSEEIGVGHIGLGVRGGTLIRKVAGTNREPGIKGVKVVAVCDVYKPHLQKGIDRSNNPSVRTYTDYRDLLADKGVDAVVIATPDHWHSQMVIDAANAGKDIYIEKGWTRTVPEAKAMLAAVKKNNVVMQLGHQGREKAAGLQAAQLIDEDVLGPVTLVRTGRMENRPLGRNIWRWYGGYNEYERPDPAQVIRDLDWKQWVGPLSARPFSMEHFWHWRCYFDYGTGIAGDLLSHEIDFVQSVLRYGIPDSCTCAGQISLLKDGRDVPDTWNTIYEYEKRGCTVTFVSSMNTREPGVFPEFRGKDAWLLFDSIAQSVTTFDVCVEPDTAKYNARIEKGEIDPNKPFMTFDPSKTPEQPSHQEDFFNCVRSREKPKCNEDEAFIEAVTAIMSVEAFKKERKVRWDRQKQEIV